MLADPGDGDGGAPGVHDDGLHVGGEVVLTGLAGALRNALRLQPARQDLHGHAREDVGPWPEHGLAVPEGEVPDGGLAQPAGVVGEGRVVEPAGDGAAYVEGLGGLTGLLDGGEEALVPDD